jgi:DNA polymerase III subunit chi
LGEPRVSFYVLPGREERDRQALACRLVEKAWHSGHRVHVTLDDAAAARAFDELLWQFSDISFVPHALAGDAAAAEAPVRIGTATEPAGDAEVLVNLSAALPGEPERFERIVEVIDAEESRRRQGRERFRAYRERGIMPETHNLGDA